MDKFLHRIEMLVGEKNLMTIQSKKVIVFGVGGVGGQAAESIVRSGIGHITIVDRDVVDITNINRQVVALNSNVGDIKVEALRKRLLDINPNLGIKTIYDEVNETTINGFDLEEYDFVVDAIDSIRDKITLIEYCFLHQIPIISSMGAGNRFDPTKVIITDVFKTKDDPLAKIIRGALRKMAIKKLVVVTSLEPPVKTGLRTPSSSPFVPPAYGLAIASYIFQYFLNNNVK
jgi:tRNA A37 threonylcarbamoyladenosine dehydratase